jgi:hypothetical protein
LPIKGRLRGSKSNRAAVAEDAKNSENVGEPTERPATDTTQKPSHRHRAGSQATDTRQEQEGPAHWVVCGPGKKGYWRREAGSTLA